MDPHSFFADPDPDVFLNADHDPDANPDPDPEPFYDLQFCPILSHRIKGSVSRDFRPPFFS